MTYLRGVVGACLAFAALGACRDCPDEMQIESLTIEENFTPLSIKCPPASGGCEVVIVGSLKRTTKCVPIPPGSPPVTPPPVPTVNLFDPLAAIAYSWDYSSSLAILGQSRMDFSGSTIPLATQGPALIYAIGHSGAVMGSLSTQWTKSGEEVRLANESIVAGWMASTPSACGFQVEVKTNSTLPLGRHTAAVAAEYLGQPIVSANREFTYTGGSFDLIAMELN